MLAPIDKCTGCMACFNICPVNCIMIKEDQEGFQQPIIDKSICINCGKCTKACPILNKPERILKINPIVYAVWNKDSLILKNSTSGGAFGALAKQVIDMNGLVFGAAYTENLMVKHICINSQNELIKLQGSKYVQSEICDIYKSVKKSIEQKQIVLFAGTPCQIAGLYGFLGSDYNSLITCDFVCHGVPSPGVYKSYINYIEQKEISQLLRINMRTKRRGWNPVLDMRHVYKNGKVIELNDAFNDPYMNGFLYDLYLRKSCYECPYANLTRESDITMGDFWGIGNDIPFTHQTKQGVSLIMVNTEKGNKFFDKCKADIYYEERSVDEAVKGNIMLTPRKHSNPLRKNFFDDFESLSFEELVPKYLKRKHSIKHRTINLLLNIIGRKNIKKIKNVVKSR